MHVYDIIIKSGMVIDKKAGVNRVVDLAIAGGMIRKIGGLEQAEAEMTVDASGCYVTPGLVDYHAHVFVGGSDFSIQPEAAAFPSGVTTIVDAGTTGIAAFPAFAQDVIARSLVTIKAGLNVCTIGQASHRYLENFDPELMDIDAISRLCERYPDDIVALKLRLSRNIVGDLERKPLGASVAIAEQVKKRLIVHASDLPGDIGETLDMLRPGDVFCHVFHNTGQNILGGDGRVRPELLAARQRGVLFDMAHGSRQFSNDVARAAISQGFLPDIISSDLSQLSLYKPPTYNLLHVMSKLLNLGMEFEEILNGCTAVPYTLLDGGYNGTILEGGRADLAVLQIRNESIRYSDRFGSDFVGEKVICPMLTVKDGSVVYRQYNYL